MAKAKTPTKPRGGQSGAPASGTQSRPKTTKKGKAGKAQGNAGQTQSA